MKALGLIGGTSWHSTIEYYRNINQAVNKHFGNNTNPPLLLFNQNQALIHRLQRENNWQAIAELFVEAGQKLERAGATALLFCANTPHKIYEAVVPHISIPILHIVDATAKAILQAGLSKVCFIGTRFSMEEAFLSQRFVQCGVELIMPADAANITELHRIIQQELTFGNVRPSSKQFVIQCIEAMLDAGAQGVVLGCTEFPLMIAPEDVPVPMFNTTELHSHAACAYILSEHTQA